MSLSIFNKVTLAAVSAVAPANERCLADEAEYYGGSLEKAAMVTRVSGLDKRRVSPDGVTASDLCAAAARRLFDEGGLDPASIDLLFFISQSPDYLLPASAAILQDRLGLSPGCAVMDMNVGCAGFVHGLMLAGALVEAGACARALVLVGDTQARFLDPANRATAPVFGDAGSAALLERDEAAAPMSFLAGTDGSGFESLIIPGGGGRIPPLADEGPEAPFNRVIRDPEGNPWTLGGYGHLYMQGMTVFTFGVTMIPPHIKRHLELAGIGAPELDWLFLHQANRLMVESIAKKSGLGLEKAPWSTLGRYGNLGAASLPALLCDQLSGHAEGRGKKAMLCAFGAGLAWSSCLLSLEKTRLLPVAEYQTPERPASREELIAHWHKIFYGKESS